MNWKLWLIGLFEVTLSGGTTAFSTNLVDPHEFNVYTKQFWMVAGASALMSAGKYVFRTLSKAAEKAESECDKPQQPAINP